MPHAEYSPIRELFGGRNKVLLAERKDRLYALKFVNLTDLQPGGLHAAVEELKLLRTLNHPNVIRLRECEIIHKNSLECMMIVTDFAQGGSLAERFEAMQSSAITLDWLLAVSRWSAQTAAALKYCHEKNVIHRDLKLENILISASGDALLADFGFARELSSSGHASTVLGTPMNMAPELWTTGATYGRGTDLWALGCVIFELTCLRHPFEQARDPKALRDLVMTPSPTLSDRLRLSGVLLNELIPPSALELATGILQVAALMLSQDADSRPTCALLVSTPPFAGMTICLTECE